MANSISNWVFFDENSTQTTSNYLSNPCNASAITLQVDVFGGSVSLTIEGMNDLNKEEDYFPIKCVGLGDFKTYTTITSAGLYMIPFSGIQRLRLKADSVGGFKAYGIAVD